MKALYRIGATLVCLIVFATAVPVDAATKKTPKAVVVSDPVEAATVNLYCRVKLGGVTYLTTGTGVFISDRGVILTNAHVGQFFLLTAPGGKSKGTCSVRSGSPAKDQYSAGLLYLSPAWISSYTAAVSKKSENTGSGQEDFALLYVTKAKKGNLPERFPVAPLATLDTIAKLKGTEAVSVVGYPAEKQDYEDIRDDLKILVASSTLSGVRSFQKPFNDILVISPSKAGQSGISGGPVAQAGSLLGIATTLSGEKMKSLRGLRALTLTYVDRTVRFETGTPLSGLYAGNLAERAVLTLDSYPADIRKALETTLRRMR